MPWAFVNVVAITLPNVELSVRLLHPTINVMVDASMPEAENANAPARGKIMEPLNLEDQLKQCRAAFRELLSIQSQQARELQAMDMHAKVGAFIAQYDSQKYQEIVSDLKAGL